jgi:hypothetical protein
MGDAVMWKEVQDIWAKHCFHRHAKCRLHPRSCNTSACPAHGARALADNPVKTELKRKGSSAPLLVKREVKAEEGEVNSEQQPPSPLPFNRRRGSSRINVRRAPPPSYTPVPDSEGSEDGERDALLSATGGVPLFADDTPSPTASPATTRDASYDPDAPAAGSTGRSASPVARSTRHSASTRSPAPLSSASTVAAKGKGKGRSVPRRVEQRFHHFSRRRVLHKRDRLNSPFELASFHGCRGGAGAGGDGVGCCCFICSQLCDVHQGRHGAP